MPASHEIFPIASSLQEAAAQGTVISENLIESDPTELMAAADSVITEQSLEEIYNANLSTLISGDKSTSIKHKDGKVYAGTLGDAEKKCPHMAGKNELEIAEDIAFANLASVVRARKLAQTAVVKKAQITVKKREETGTPQPKHKVDETAKVSIETEVRLAQEKSPLYEVMACIQRQALNQTVEPIRTVSTANKSAENRVVKKLAKRKLTAVDAPVENRSRVPGATKSQAVRTKPPTVEASPVISPMSESIITILPDVDKIVVVDKVRVTEPVTQPVIQPLSYDTQSPVFTNSDELYIIQDFSAGSITEVFVSEGDTEAYVSEINTDASKPQTFLSITETENFEVDLLLDETVERGHHDKVGVTTKATPETQDAQETDPVVVAAKIVVDFISETVQLMPSEEGNKEFIERLLELPPEAVVELESQVEKLSVVADRLHELVASGVDDGEEGIQIRAFLRREFEILLVSVGIRPTPEALDTFIAYVCSENYAEGTHEKKLFDEQGVFAKARLASIKWGHSVGTMIGRVAVNRSAA